jgi:hypothetical protein
MWLALMPLLSLPQAVRSSCLPKLGLYIGHEQEVPPDYIDLLAAIAPRPTLLIIPTKDRDATFTDVTNCTNIAKSFWNARGDEHALTISQPEDYNRISPYANETLAAWAEGLTQRPRPGGTVVDSGREGRSRASERF